MQMHSSLKVESASKALETGTGPVFQIAIFKFLVLHISIHSLCCLLDILTGPRNVESLKTFVLEEAEKAAMKAELENEKDL
ncbi:hypothetical protein CK203_112922 [Vitis vinifera]|uniref:Uncharacterized protein n=1 Tax=Vitis vinifera TaxID=29760 RepID=A0A438BNV6_VITVI|nr:hypothetical protein CK203_112922 [Vitis vinifera]